MTTSVIQKAVSVHMYMPYSTREGYTKFVFLCLRLSILFLNQARHEKFQTQNTRNDFLFRTSVWIAMKQQVALDRKCNIKSKEAF